MRPLINTVILLSFIHFQQAPLYGQEPTRAKTHEIQNEAVVSCHKNMHQALHSMDKRHRQRVETSLNTIRTRSALLSQLRTYPAPTLEQRKFAQALQLYGQLKNTDGAETQISRKTVLGENLLRSLIEIRNYLNQPQLPGICAGAKEFAQFYKEQNKQLYMRHNLYIQSKERIMREIELEKAIKSEITIDINNLNDEEKNIETLQYLTENYANQRLTLLAHMYFWLQESAKRFEGFKNDFDNLLNEIIMAQEIHCGC